MLPKTRIFVAASLVSVLLDQATKLTIDANLSFSDRITVIENFFYITHARNPGAAFGLFGDAPVVIRLTLFIGMTLVALGMVVIFALVTGRILKLATDSNLFTGITLSLTYFLLINLLLHFASGGGG
jgi:lipoprotein signal peptidase